MDLPTCPACGQSVIDDDATHCPFCDASMTGKPVAGGPQQAPQQKSQTPAASVPQPVPRPSASSAKTSDDPGEADEADPFDIDSTVGKNVIPIRPKPSQGRSVKVVCPMCDTPGFISRKAAGRDVRCCNSTCMVPVFTAPASEVDPRAAADEVSESSGPSSTMIGVGVGVAILLVVGAVWFFTSGNTDKKSNGQLATGPSMLDGPATDDKKNALAENKADKTDGSPETPRETPLADLKEPAIKRMVNAAREQKNNRSKPFCRQMCAESFAYFGDLQRVDEQLQQLVKVGPRQVYYQVRPLTVVAWRHLEQGDEVAARQTVERAWALAQGLPNFGRVPIDLSTALAAVLVRVGRVEDAKRLISGHNSRQNDGQLSAAIEMRRGFEFANQSLPFRRALSPWADPQSVAVTVVLAAHGLFEASREWALQTPSGRTQIECLLVWAQCLAQAASVNEKPELLEMLPPVTTAMSAAGRARLFAGVSIIQWDCGDQQAAAKSVKLAAEALDALTLPPGLEMPDTKGILDLKLPAGAPLVSAAVAATEVSRAQAVSNQKEAAWRSLTKAIQFCDGMAPPKFAVDEEVQLVSQAGDLLAGQLQSELALDNADQGRIAARNYRKAIQAMAAASAQSFQLQVQLLQHAVRWGMHTRIWDVIGASAADASQRSPLLYTSLPYFVRSEYVRDGENQKVAQIVKAVVGLKRAPQHKDDLELTARVYATNQKFREAAQMIETDQRVDDDEWKLNLCLDLIDVVMSGESIESALEFVQGLKNPLWRELLLAEVTAVATRKGQGQAMWKFAQTPKLAPTELVTICRSLLIGISLRPAEKPAEETPPAE
ncbi:MAG: zinc ribbon domain-containing protein [Planctomycetaceae bacterium]